MYSQIDQLLSSLPKGRTEIPAPLSFQLMKNLLRALESPHKSLKNVIHVAGTNGKGSTVASLRSFLQSQGYSVNSYTSPHLVHVTERIQLQDTLISAENLLEYLEHLQLLQKTFPFTYFHALTACAFLAFKESPADFTLIEVGMGGQFDSTNVIDSPLATVFTPISYDHQAFLGNTLLEIATEKLGIAKANVPMFSAYQPPEVQHLFKSYATKLNNPLYEERKDWLFTKTEETLTFQLKKWEEALHLPEPSLLGAHQFQNTSLALACLSFLGLIHDVSSLKESLKTIEFAGRLMRIRNQKTDIWLDGAHNTSAAHVIAHHVKNAWKREKVNLVFSMTKQQDVHDFLRIMKPFIQTVYCPFMGDPFIDRSIIEKTCWALKIPYRESDTLESCLTLASNHTSTNANTKLLITGSLYLVGAALKVLDSPPL